MNRKDSDKDSERPHYYSQFWLDIAAGRRTIGGPKPEEEGELLEDSQEPIALRRSFRSEPEEDLDEIEEPVGRGERPAVLSRPVADTVSPSFDDVNAEAEADEVPLAADDMDSLAVNDSVEDADIPDFATDEDDVEDEEDTGDADEEEDFFEDEEEDEDDGWVAGRGRKKVTPKRATKQPPKRPTRRDPRRGF